jgi:hypothetical protein
VAQLAAEWGFSIDKIRERFRNEPGVLKLKDENAAKKRKRSYVTPHTLWPPNGQSVLVTVSGSITLAAEGSYSFVVPLIAARNGDDKDGRTHTNVTGSDKIGNVGACSVVVTVPHDQGQ